MPSKRAESSKVAASPSKRRAYEPLENTHAAETGVTVKRRKGLGLRVIGGRIYDSENGKTCHQCRQKTLDLVASCKASSRSRPCTQHYCAKCLLNRYGEKVTDVVQLTSWSCPRCRGECNCSICLKKQGHEPTGILAHTAKATGFTSVAELLKNCSSVKANHMKAPLSPSHKGKKAEIKGAMSPTPGQKSVNSKSKKRKLVVTENGDIEGPVANALLRTPPTNQKRACMSHSLAVSSPTNTKKAVAKLNLSVPVSSGKKVKKISNAERTLGGVSELDLSLVKSEVGQALPIKSKKRSSENKNSADIEENKSEVNQDIKVAKKNRKLDAKVKVERGTETGETEGKSLLKKEAKKKDILCNEGGKCKLGTLKNCKVETKEPKKEKKKTMRSEVEKQIVLPPGVPLSTVVGMDFPAEAIGPAVQFIEFCLAFQSVLGLRRGDAEAMLRELTKGRLVRKGPNSLLVQLHAKLLNIIESSFSDSSDDVTQSSTGKRSWLNILKKHLNERSVMFSGVSMDADKVRSMSFKHVYPAASTVVPEKDLRTIKNAIEEGAESYENLGLYHKLQLLVILCDDSLETRNMRDHIESVNREHNEAQKGHREEFLAARKEVRDAKQKIKDAEVAKLIAQGNINGPLTHEDQVALIAKVRVETERAVAAASLEKESVSRMKKGRNDAVRTDAFARGPDGRSFYKLKGIENMNCVVVQECKVEQFSLDSWRVYSEEDEAVLTKFLLQRAKLLHKKMLSEAGLEDLNVEFGDAEKENRIPNSVAVKVEPVS